MKSTADVVIVGGGVIGASILFNLGRMGVADTLLLEKDVLGSGSTGRSQAGCIPPTQSPRPWLGRAWASSQISARSSAESRASSKLVTW